VQKARPSRPSILPGQRSFPGGEGAGSAGVTAGLAQARGAGEVDRDKLRDAALGHRDAEQAIDARDRDAVMRDQEETGSGGVGDLADEAAEAVDIGVVEGCVGVEHSSAGKARGRRRHRLSWKRDLSGGCCVPDPSYSAASASRVWS
jgi:hypothetical protein